jgi:hypothetical protein
MFYFDSFSSFVQCYVIFRLKLILFVVKKKKSKNPNNSFVANFKLYKTKLTWINYHLRSRSRCIWRKVTPKTPIFVNKIAINEFKIFFFLMIILFRSLCLKQKQKKFFITLPAEDIDKKLYLVKKNKKSLKLF